MLDSESKEFKSYVKLDSDDKWFNNPQYRIKVTKKTRIIMSLMQKDNRSAQGSNVYKPCNFILVRARQKNNRVWEMPPKEDIVKVGFPEGKAPK